MEEKRKKMKLKIVHSGLFTQVSNDEVSLVGGFRSGSSPADCTRLKFDIYSNTLLDKLAASGVDEKAAYQQSKVGFCELFVRDDTDFDIVGLVNIEIKKNFKRKGYATTVVNSIRNTIDGDLVVRDIQPGVAAKFWKSLGVEFDREIKSLTKKSFAGGVNGTLRKDLIGNKRLNELGL